jgi:nucleoside-diphosphate-sugar epimerase
MTKVSKAVVTGGAGFIGSHIVDELLSRGIETYVVDNLSTGSLTNLSAHKDNKLLHVFIGSIRDIGSILDKVNGIDVVFHEAAIASVPISVQNPLLVHDTNTNMTLELMNFCIRKQIRRFIFASSAAVYGTLDESAASENLLCRPLSPYGASKLAAEDYIQAYKNTYGLESVILRYFNVYGLRQKLSQYSGVITIFLDKLLTDQDPAIYGDGLQVRDFVHARDVAQANILSMESKDAVGEIFNVGSGKPATILQILNTMKTILGIEHMQIDYITAREGDMRYALASIKKISDILGFEPRVSLDYGLKELIEHRRGIIADHFGRKATVQNTTTTGATIATADSP